MVGLLGGRGEHASHEPRQPSGRRVQAKIRGGVENVVSGCWARPALCACCPAASRCACPVQPIAAALGLIRVGAAQTLCGCTCAAGRLVIASKGQRASHRLHPVQRSASTSTAYFLRRSVWNVSTCTGQTACAAAAAGAAGGVEADRGDRAGRTWALRAGKGSTGAAVSSGGGIAGIYCLLHHRLGPGARAAAAVVPPGNRRGRRRVGEVGCKKPLCLPLPI